MTSKQKQYSFLHMYKKLLIIKNRNNFYSSMKRKRQVQSHWCCFVINAYLYNNCLYVLRHDIICMVYLTSRARDYNISYFYIHLAKWNGLIDIKHSSSWFYLYVYCIHNMYVYIIILLCYTYMYMYNSTKGTFKWNIGSI